MHKDGHLTRLDLAFSRDQDHKIYVQDRMLEQASELFRWLEDGASLYVCGDASRMAKDVDATLHTIVEKHRQLRPRSRQPNTSSSSKISTATTATSTRSLSRSPYSAKEVHYAAPLHELAQLRLTRALSCV